MQNTLTLPTFPSCANPEGSVQASYSDGTHGIVGSSDTYIGRDVVYTLSDQTVTQCFCSVDNQGIQTNWWVASSLSDSQLSVLKSEGWHYVPAGNLWGLSSVPYIAQNIAYSCQGGSTLGATTTSDTVPSSNADGEVLGLAATGDSLLVYAVFILAAILLFFGIHRLSRGHSL